MSHTSEEIEQLHDLNSQKQSLLHDKEHIQECSDFNLFKVLSRANYESLEPCLGSVRSTAIGCIDSKIEDIDDQLEALQS